MKARGIWKLWFRQSRPFPRHADSAWSWLPSRCAVCRDWPGDPLCESCVARFAPVVPRCQRCALRVPAGMTVCGACLLQPPMLDLCLCATDYTWPWRDVIRQFKFHDQPAWAGPLAALMLSSPWVEDALEQADCVLPMPLSCERLAVRGYNQALLLARKLAPDKTGPHVLLRTRDTPAQSTLPRHERLANLADALAVDPLQVDQVRHRRVLLVDDVMTSGASLHAAAKALRHLGAAHVSAVVLARTPEDATDHDETMEDVFQ